MGSPIPSDSTTENIVTLSGIGLSPDWVERDNGPNATPAGMGKAEANIVRLVTPGEADQKGEMISPLSPSPVTKLPPDFDFIASKTDDEKIEYIQSVLARSEDEAIAVIAPALRLYGTAGSVVEAYLPLILEVKKHLCRPGRPKVDPATGGRSKTWEEVCKEHFHMSIRRMQQILASLKEPTPLGKGGTPDRRPPIDRDDYERARQVAAPAMTLAEAVVKQGMGDKFPEALEIFRLADVPVPDVQPASDPVPDPDPGVMEALRQRVNLMADTHEIAKALHEFFSGLIQPLLEQHQYGPSSTICVEVSRRGCSRIGEGDWVEYKGGDTQLTERAGRDKTLGRVVGMDNMGRPRIRWHNGQAWGKPYSLYHNNNASSLRVLFDFQAAAQFPEAYGSYPAEGEGAAAPSPEAKQGMSEEASCPLSMDAPEPPSDGAGVPTADAARREETAKHECPLSDLEIIMKWSQTNWGTAKDIVAQCPDLAEKRVKKVGEMCEQLVAEGRLKATDAPGLHYIGQAGEYYRELRKKGVREVWTGSGNSRQRVLI
ncbi:MAG: hypothetical protein ABSH01_20495 [Terriglobia bacterium]